MLISFAIDDQVVDEVTETVRLRLGLALTAEQLQQFFSQHPHLALDSQEIGISETSVWRVFCSTLAKDLLGPTADWPISVTPGPAIRHFIHEFQEAARRAGYQLCK